MFRVSTWVLADADQTAAVVTHLKHSLVIVPDVPPYPPTEHDLRRFAAQWIAPLVLDSELGRRTAK